MKGSENDAGGPRGYKRWVPAGRGEGRAPRYRWLAEQAGLASAKEQAPSAKEIPSSNKQEPKKEE